MGKPSCVNGVCLLMGPNTSGKAFPLFNILHVTRTLVCTWLRFGDFLTTPRHMLCAWLLHNHCGIIEWHFPSSKTMEFTV